MNGTATLARRGSERVLPTSDHELVFACGTAIVTGAVAIARLSARVVHAIAYRFATESAEMTIMTFASIRTSCAIAALALVAATASANAQGVRRGAEDGFIAGNQVLGPVGGVVGGAVGGVVGGVSGGVAGVLGIPQDPRTSAERAMDNRQVRVQRRRNYVR